VEGKGTPTECSKWSTEPEGDQYNRKDKGVPRLPEERSTFGLIWEMPLPFLRLKYK
jgi:hypothetical protein